MDSFRELTVMLMLMAAWIQNVDHDPKQGVWVEACASLLVNVLSTVGLLCLTTFQCIGRKRSNTFLYPNNYII